MLLTAAAGAASEKPEAFCRFVEQTLSGSKVELFSHRQRRGFVARGNAISKIA
jgi:hypothetical protein